MPAGRCGGIPDDGGGVFGVFVSWLWVSSAIAKISTPSAELRLDKIKAFSPNAARTKRMTSRLVGPKKRLTLISYLLQSDW